MQPSREDDTKWPQKNKDGRQELEIRLGSEHISFEVRLTTFTSSASTDMFRPPKSARCRTCKSRQTQKGFVFSTTLSKTSRRWSSR